MSESGAELGQEQGQEPGQEPGREPGRVYRRGLERWRAEQARLGRRFGWIAQLRLLLFAGMLGLLVAGLWQWSAPRWGLLAGAGACLLGFLVAAGVHERVVALRRRAAGLEAVNRRALARLGRDFEQLDELPAWPRPAAGLVRDLDLAGRASLWRLLGTARSPLGDALLADWLLQPAAPETIAARQRAVVELAGRLELRQELERLAGELPAAAAASEGLLAWAESPPWLLARPWLSWLARGLTAATLLLIGLDAAGVTGPALWLAPLLVNLVLSALCLGPLNRAFGRGEDAARVFGGYAGLLAAAGGADFADARLAELAAAMGDGRAGARRGLRRLERLLHLSEVRRSTLAAIIAQGLLLWDFHLLERLERWRLAAGGRLRGWLAALAELEALAALAALAHAQPDWARPDIAPRHEKLSARALGHPLLAPAACVTNDVSLGPAGSCLLVTGSNMSGKSTLLRAVGLDLILAGAGGVACAAAFSAPPAALVTSFRVTDALERGRSYFLAELEQLEAAVSRARQVAAAGEQVPVFLFDEILLGTNAQERRVAVERVLAHLLGLGAFGAVATHDLSLADAASLAGRLQPVHFREQYSERDGRVQMHFDFKLRPGLTPTTNALRLLAMVGLDEPDPHAAPGGGEEAPGGSEEAPGPRGCRGQAAD